MGWPQRRGDISGDVCSTALRRPWVQGVSVSVVHREVSTNLCRSFHCEGRIVTTLFGLLFWDVIFAPVPGAFETPFQSAPLDIAEDTFYIARQEMADKRLEEIKNGEALKILARVLEEHSTKGTWCTGVRWDLFQTPNLLEIAEVSGRDLQGTMHSMGCCSASAVMVSM